MRGCRNTRLLIKPGHDVRAEFIAYHRDHFANICGTSSAGIYTLTGTIGQPNVTRLHSRDFTLDGGTWSIIAAIQEPEAPLLSIRQTETNTVVVSWPISWPGFELEECRDPIAPAWTKVSVQPTEVVVVKNRTEKQVILQKPDGNRFYHLKKPLRSMPGSLPPPCSGELQHFLPCTGCVVSQNTVQRAGRVWRCSVQPRPRRRPTPARGERTQLVSGRAGASGWFQGSQAVGTIRTAGSSRCGPLTGPPGG